MKELSIQNLSCRAETNLILKGVNLTVHAGDCLALLGPNGHGKSTLLNTLMGSPHYQVVEGQALLDGEDILKLTPDQRSKRGMFLAFQNPPDVPGVITMDFFRSAINSHQDKPISLYNFYKETTKAYEQVGLNSNMASRTLNDGYSGGEKKRNEILQMLLLKPSLAFLDEIDSGLDIDALNLIAKVITDLRQQGTTFIIISHYDKLYDLIKPNRSAIIVDGRIALEGDFSLAKKVSEEGYSFLERDYHISIEKKEQTSIGTCAVKETVTK